MKEKIKGPLFVLVSGTCWGFSGTCGQYLFNYKNVNAEWLSSYRMLFAGILMVILAIFTQRENIKGILHNKLDRIALLIFGTDNVVIPAMIIILVLLLSGRKKLC